MRKSLVASIAIGLLGYAAGACAHDGPEEVVAALSAEIDRLGPSADRLYRRGCEYAALRNNVDAEADLRQALALRRDYPTVQALVRVLVSRGALAEASNISEAEVALRARSPDAAALALDGDVRMARGRYAAAIERFDAALAKTLNIDWYLARSRAQAKLERYADRIADLRDGLGKSESPVLLGELCDAMIARVAADGTPSVAAEARAIVDRELAANRYRAAWLIRSARLRFIGGGQGPAQQDLYETLLELDGRIRPDRPDVTLVAERAVAKLLLRRDAEAREDFLLARKHRAPAWLMEPLVERFGDLPPPPTKVID